MKKACEKPRLAVGAASVVMLGGVQRADPDDDGGELFGAGNLREQRVLLGGPGLVRTSCCARNGSTPLLGRQFMFTGLILADRGASGQCIIALAMPRQGIWVPVCLVTMALPMLIPWNVVGAMWNIFTLPDIGLLGYFL